jgi:hypothetical protein
MAVLEEMDIRADGMKRDIIVLEFWCLWALSRE